MKNQLEILNALSKIIDLDLFYVVTIYAADHQTIESTFLSQRTERWHRGVKIK